MKTWKFQLAVALMAGLFAGQAAMAVPATFLSLTSEPTGIAPGNNFRHRVYELTVDPDGAPGSATITTVDTFISMGEIVAITADPTGNNGDFLALTAGGTVSRGVRGFGITEEFQTEPAVFYVLDNLFTLPGSPSFGVGGAIVFDSENGNLLINNVGDQTLTAVIDPFGSASDFTAPYTIGGVGSTVGPIADREIIALGESSVIALGDINDNHFDDSGFGLYDVISDPFDDLFADIGALDNNLYPESLDGFLGTGSVYNLQHFEGDGGPTTSRLSYIADVHPVGQDLSIKDVRDITNLFSGDNLLLLNDLRGLARIDAIVVDDVAVPEPVTGVLGLLGLAALGATTRRRVA